MGDQERLVVAFLHLPNSCRDYSLWLSSSERLVRSKKGIHDLTIIDFPFRSRFGDRSYILPVPSFDANLWRTLDGW